MDTKTFFALREAEAIKPQIDALDTFLERNSSFKGIIDYLRKLITDNTINKQLIEAIYESLNLKLINEGNDISIDLITDLLSVMRDPSLVQVQLKNAESLFKLASDFRENYINIFNPEDIESLEMIELERYKKLFADRRVATVHDTLDNSEDQDKKNLDLVKRRIEVIKSNEDLNNKISALKRRLQLNREGAIFAAIIEVRDVLRILSTDVNEDSVNVLREIIETIPSSDYYNEFVEQIRVLITEEEPTEG